MGDSDAFLEYALNEFRYQDNTPMMMYNQMQINTFKKILEQNAATRQYVYLDIIQSTEEDSLKGTPQKVIFELFVDLCPKTCDNFKKLCNGAFINK